MPCQLLDWAGIFKFHDRPLYERISVISMTHQKSSMTTTGRNALFFYSLVFTRGGATRGSGIGLWVSSLRTYVRLLGAAGLNVVGLVGIARGEHRRALLDIGVSGIVQGVRYHLSQVKEKITASNLFSVIPSFSGSTKKQGIDNSHSCGAKL